MEETNIQNKQINTIKPINKDAVHKICSDQVNIILTLYILHLLILLVLGKNK